MRFHTVSTEDITCGPGRYLQLATRVPGWFRVGEEVTASGDRDLAGTVIAVDLRAGIVHLAARA